ncbi:Protein FAM49A [Acipenser ruthenus]|uniref:Protein FAM49A n=1 Tax=Acipenser ruthenus TaxID=7906 RepID=A0A662YUT2_ACIRT|nr:Protein FAM49A [Acipenser ruthenus]
MRNPAIQNDFSYYRRTISRNRINNMNIEIESEVNNEMANRMSLFYAEATPMLKTLSNATTNFVFEMRNPAIQNDFSYYRRTISRNRINNMNIEIESEVNNEMANRMSLFYAEATPMLKTLSNATTNFVFENKTLPLENTTDCLSTMASVCKVMLETPDYTSRFNSEDTQLFCMRVMVGVIILYDHVHPAGAFTKASKIDMKGCIKVLKEQPADNVEGLVNALK